MSEDSKGNNVKVQIADELQAGTYANAASVNVNPNDIVLDFGVILPNVQPTTIKVQSRVILSHNTAQSFLSILQDAVLDWRNKQNEHKQHNEQNEE
ncbi:DUF3467 domain-containing protein [Patescibacteria group bacterium]|nr:DUF3467 domain-containing protein [Patescibacteria group bacterium]